MKAINLYIESKLPEEMRDMNRSYDVKGVNNMLAELARKHPTKYEEVSSLLSNVGRAASYKNGDTIGIEDLAPVIDRDAILADMDKEILESARKLGKNSQEFRTKREQIWQRYSDMIEKRTMDAALRAGNPIGLSVASGARGKAPQLRAMISTPGAYTDYKGRVIPNFARKSFSEGVRPVDFLAGSFGARPTVVSTKSATAKGGYLAKLLTQVTSDQVVTEEDCGTNNGLDMDVVDGDIKGRVLASGPEGIPSGTFMDGHAVSALRKKKPKGSVVVRSPITCQSEHGVCAKCAGSQPGGKLPDIGDHVGITSANSIGEPLTQMALNCLAVGTEVVMADFSVKKIEDIQVGEFVLGSNTKGETFPVKVTHTWDQGMQPVNRYNYKVGQTDRHISVDCTEKHKILQLTKYSNCKKEALNYTPRILEAGQSTGQVSTVLPGEFVGGGVAEPMATLYGFHLGDGIRLNEKDITGPITISCACLETAESLKTCFEEQGLRMRKRKRSHDWGISDDNKPETVRAKDGTFTGGIQNRYKKFLDSVGCLHRYCHEKEIPEAVYSWDNESLAKLIAGYVCADGSVYKNQDNAPGVAFGSTSLPMLESIRRILSLRFGIHTGDVSLTSPEASSEIRKHDGYQFVITRRDQVLRFRDLIGKYIPGPKRDKLNDYLKEASVSHYQHLKHYKCRRKEVIPLGLVQCYDITVHHPDHLFVLANGLIVSNSKHTAGMASAKKDFSGFDVIQQFVQSPEKFPGKASVSEVNGQVKEVRPAPQGGTYITVEDDEYYVLPGFEPMVKAGERVEKGQQLGEGLVDPKDIIRLRGIGEGRRYYAERLGKILEDSGMPPMPRNVEMLARAAINHVIVDDPEDDSFYLPDDVVKYNMFQKNYIPRKESKRNPVNPGLRGKYLEKPVLHYTVGTQVSDSMLSRLKKADIPEIYTSDQEPSFKSQMSNLTRANFSSDDWLAKQHTSYLTQNLRDSAVRGEDTDIEANTHFVPRLAMGTNFGKNVRTTGKF